jgi:hypothetical protein
MLFFCSCVRYVAGWCTGSLCQLTIGRIALEVFCIFITARRLVVYEFMLQHLIGRRRQNVFTELLYGLCYVVLVFISWVLRDVCGFLL